MSRNRHQRRRPYREPNREEFRIIRGATPLSDIFEEDVLSDKLMLARRRIIAIFHAATEWRNGKYRGTDNYIVGLDSKQRQLAWHIHRHTNHGFVYEEDLPGNVLELRQAYIEDVISNLQYRFILAQLNQMCSPIGADVWYDEARGLWQMSQNCHDEMMAQYKGVRNAVKFDRRNWHGRPREQARARGTLPGASISYGAR